MGKDAQCRNLLTKFESSLPYVNRGIAEMPQAAEMAKQPSDFFRERRFVSTSRSPTVGDESVYVEK